MASKDVNITIVPDHDIAWHAEGDVDAILRQLGTDMNTGLSTDEAQERLRK
jgi:hypothetical protein